MLKSHIVYFRKKPQNSHTSGLHTYNSRSSNCEDEMAQGGHTRGQTPGHVMKSLTLFM